MADTPVQMQCDADGTYSVHLRRLDGSLQQVSRGLDVLAAERVTSRLLDDYAAGEPWVMAIVDVSAGQLRLIG